MCVTARLQAELSTIHAASAPTSEATQLNDACALAAASNAFGPLGTTACTSANFVALLGPFETAAVGSCLEYESALAALCPQMAACFSLSAAVLVYTFVAAGDIDTFDAAAFTTSFAAACGLPTTSVLVTVGSGSLVINATVVLPNTAAATALQQQLAGGALANPASASAALGVPVEEISEPRVDNLALWRSPAAEAAGIPESVLYGLLGGVLGVLLLLLALVMCQQQSVSKRQNAFQQMGAASSIGAARYNHQLPKEVAAGGVQLSSESGGKVASSI